MTDGGRIRGMIVVVDGWRELRRTIVRALEPIASAVHAFEDGPTAETFISEAPEPVALLVCEREVPAMGEDELAERCRIHDASLPLLLLISQGDGAHELLQRLGPPVRFLQKPFDVHRLRTAALQTARDAEPRGG